MVRRANPGGGKREIFLDSRLLLESELEGELQGERFLRALLEKQAGLAKRGGDSFLAGFQREESFHCHGRDFLGRREIQKSE